MIVHSIGGNTGKIVRTMENTGWQVFRRQDRNGVWYPFRQPNVWSVQIVKSLLFSTESTAKILAERFGPRCAGLYADTALLPLDNPDLIDEICNEAIMETHEAMDRFDKQRKRK